MSQQSNAAVFQACQNVQVNGGSFSVSGRDSHTSTVHYHTGSTAHHFGYADNVNTGPNHGNFSQGIPPGFPPYPPPNPYMGAYGYGGFPPTGSYSTSYHFPGQPQRGQTYPQPNRTPSSNGQVPPFNTGSGSSTPKDNNPFRQASQGFPQPPPNPHRSSSNCVQPEDDVEVTELDSPGVAEENGGAKAHSFSFGASASGTTFTQAQRQ